MIYDARIIPCAYCQGQVILLIQNRQSFIHAEGGQEMLEVGCRWLWAVEAYRRKRKQRKLNLF